VAYREEQAQKIRLSMETLSHRTRPSPHCFGRVLVKRWSRLRSEKALIIQKVPRRRDNNVRACFQLSCGYDEIVLDISRHGADPLWYPVDDGPITRDETRVFFLEDNLTPLPR
jgi:hypothetical protein